MNNKDSEIVALEDLSELKRPRIAFISGHIDIGQDAFLAQYQKPLELTISAGDHFNVSNAKDADTRALEYLQAQDVEPAGIKIYFHKSLEWTQQGPGRARKSEQGFRVKVVDGSHSDRDAVMTGESDYDILWVRSEEETKGLYGKKYRAGSVSGTQKNQEKRELLVRERKAGA
ncbi:hypothetical protein LTR37_015588 [Vermiconidia calcicola]|uniref:Uncharacterized protein n=1 Tax=Vermiconidia calcicola TaxID=1690605 RepID=A0ACC3MRF4_9PEZI|nr:hypothetical protein LTR37_015588 [Vermiconidia calcicola]